MTMSSSNRLHICSYNIHKGFNLGNTRYLLSKIREAIQAVNADILFLQEVVGENRKNAEAISDWHPQSQFEYLADHAWPHHAYGKNAVYSHGHHGNAILSRYPLHGTRNIDLSVLPYSYRGVLETHTTEHQLQLLCLHFGLFAFERKSQLKKVLAHIRESIDDTRPIIIAGDFNDWRNKLSRMLEDELGVKEVIAEFYGKPLPTFPARSPLFPMDRIYYRNLDLESAQVLTGEPWHSLSDHCALYAEFSLPG